MNPRIIKETRPLLPAFALAALGLPVLSLVWKNESAPGFGFGLSATGCLFMGAMSFGNEFSFRTMPLLLTQPFRRQVIWRDKMLALGAAIALSLAIFLAWLYYYLKPVFDLGEDAHWCAATAVLFAIGAYCTIPWLTLHTRSTLGGMVSSTAIPIALLLGLSALLDHFPQFKSGGEYFHQAVILFGAVLLGYFSLGYWFGRRTFIRLQFVDSQSREITVPQGLERFLAGTMEMVPGFTGPFANLLKKELQLQRLSLFFAVLFCVATPIEAVIWKLAKSELATNIAMGVLAATFAIYVIMLPLVAAGGCVAEERNWGMLGWQLTLPPSRRKQWTAKILVVFATCWLLGFLLPAILYIVEKWLFHFAPSPPGLAGLAQLDGILGMIFGYSLIISVIIFASSISANGMRAILLSLGLIIGEITLWAASFASIAFLSNISQPRSLSAGLIALIAFWLILGMIPCLTLFLAWLNYRRDELSPRRGLICAAIFLFTPLGAAFAFVFLSLLLSVF